MKDEGDSIPTIGEYKGVPLHDCQSEARLAVVRAQIDAVLAVDDTKLLLEIAGDAAMAPEARLLAAAKLRAVHAIAADDRRVRPNVDLALVEATVATVGSRNWRSATHYGSLLDPPDQAVPRDVPLEPQR